MQMDYLIFLRQMHRHTFLSINHQTVKTQNKMQGFRNTGTFRCDIAQDSEMFRLNMLHHIENQMWTVELLFGLLY